MRNSQFHKNSSNSPPGKSRNRLLCLLLLLVMAASLLLPQARAADIIINAKPGGDIPALPSTASAASRRVRSLKEADSSTPLRMTMWRGIPFSGKGTGWGE